MNNLGDSFMDYKGWVERERRIRLKILKATEITREERLYRTCERCAEVLLCHEEHCPNCDNHEIVETRIENLDMEIEQRIRCWYRFERMDEETKIGNSES